MGIKELRAKALKQAKEKVSVEKFKRDHLIIQAVETIDELDEISNLMTERVRNWYSFHYPELSKLVKNTESYLAIIKEIKTRKMMLEEKLEPFTGAQQAKKIASIATQTMGADIDEKDLERVAKLADLALHSRKERDELAEYVEDAMKDLAPNVHNLVGGMLGARLIAKAGSLERMAKMPASTVQVLGAENALFAHLKKGVPPPKHGVIFAYPAIQQAPKKQKGKLSRILANHLAIGARIDFFKHEINEALKIDLEDSIKRVIG